MVQVDVPPLEHAELAGAQVGVNGDRDQAPPLERDIAALDEGQELARVQELAQPSVPAVRSAHADRRILVPHA
ncbi:MAG: hypothetical protein WDO69_24295 [Pseudomonadota bacterium]